MLRKILTSERSPMRQLAKGVAGLVISLLFIVNASAQAVNGDLTFVIHAGQILVEPGKPPLSQHTIVIKGNKITQVISDYIEPQEFGEKTRLIDLSDHFILPGLMDMHMHISSIHSMDLTLQEVTLSDADIAFYAAQHAKKMLAAGYTTIRDVGDNRGISFALKNAIAKGVIPGPRIFASGNIVTRSGGHGTQSMLLEQYAKLASHARPCDGPESCRKAVRLEVAKGADLIKTTVSGSAMDEWSSDDAKPTSFKDEVDALFATASQLNRPVAAHAHSTASINEALRYGAKSIEHGTYFDNESVKLFKKSGTYLVPTSFVAEFGLKMMENFKAKISPEDWERLQKTTQTMYSTSGRAYKAGIKLATGTDLGVSKTVENVRELEIFVDNGIPENEAIRAATVHPADILGVADKLGQIREGFLADIIATKQSPLENISSLREIDFVMQDGQLYKLAGQWIEPELN